MPQPFLPLRNFISIFLFLFGIFIFVFSISPKAIAQMDIIKELYGRAVSAYNNQQYDQAMDYYQQITKVDPSFAPAYNGLALANEASTGDEDKTIEYLKKAIQYDPKMTQAYDNLGRIYFGRQDIDDAQNYFEQALKIDPNLTSAQLSMAWIYLMARSKPEMALKYFKQVLPVDQDPKIYYGMGIAYFASNQRSGALDIITKLRSLGQEDLATRLEDTMRSNPEVNTNANEDQTAQSSQPVGLGPLTPTEDKPTGMQVHLRGKISDY